jgi:hypothetical protein
MAIYKSAELLKMISEIVNDGYKYVDVTELEGSLPDPSDDEDGEYDDLPTSLCFEVIDEHLAGIDYESVDSCEFPTVSDIHAPEPFHGNDICGSIAFTFDEIFTIKHATDNALEYFKECSEDPEIPKDILAEIKTSTVSCRNLQAKLAKLLKRFKIS